jgi:hypothetical protein
MILRGILSGPPVSARRLVYNHTAMVDLIAKHRQQLVELCRKYDVARLDVFGSAVRGDFDPAHSDLDFLVDFHNFTTHVRGSMESIGSNRALT